MGSQVNINMARWPDLVMPFLVEEKGMLVIFATADLVRGK